MSVDIPESGPDFEIMMREIDTALAEDDIPISARPMRAIMNVATRHKIRLPIGMPGPGAPEELRRHGQLAENINDWYRINYGDRIKVDPCVGRVVVLIDRDLYTLQIPRIYGEVRFELSREFVERSSTFSRGPAVSNVLQLIESLTPAKAATLSDDTLKKIFESFRFGLEGHDILEATQDVDLVRIARGDIQTAIGNLMDRAERYGESKWASLQAAEKTLKAAITLEHARFSFSHNLDDLCRKLETLGIRFDYRSLTKEIQCSPGIRYGQEACSRAEALAAHHASLKLPVDLARAGAKFKRGLGRTQRR